MVKQYENIILEIDAQIAKITLNRPSALNALCDQLNNDLLEALEIIQSDLEIRALILTGGTKAFAAGADIKEMMTAGPFEAERTATKAHLINDMLEALPIPVIAAINGPALGGGCELALSCDFRIAGENAMFGLPEVGLGIIPGAGGSPRLTKLIGTSKAKEFVMLGKVVKGSEAQAIGIVTQCVPDDAVMETVEKMAKKIVDKPAAAVKYAKEIINYAGQHDIATSKIYEKKLFSLTFATDDQLEGMQAFHEKRKPNFNHKR